MADETWYIIRCQSSKVGDYVRTPNSGWTSYARYRAEPHAGVLLFDTMDKAQAMIDEISKRADAWNGAEQWHKMWELSIEEVETDETDT